MINFIIFFLNFKYYFFKYILTDNVNFKGILLVSILLIFILALPAVCANENATNNMTSASNNGNLASDYDFDVNLDNQKTPQYGEDLLNVVLPQDAEGSISCTINTKKFDILADDLYFDEAMYGEPTIRIRADDLIYGVNTLSFTYILSKINGKYLKNKKIIFKFNGKKYAAKTNSKGVAKVSIKSNILKKLKVGKKITYQATYLKDTVKKSVKVKK